MTYEPGTADIMTTMPPLFPGEVSARWSERTPSGWTVSIEQLQLVQRIDLYMPSGKLASTVLRLLP